MQQFYPTRPRSAPKRPRCHMVCIDPFAAKVETSLFRSTEGRNHLSTVRGNASGSKDRIGCSHLQSPPTKQADAERGNNQHINWFLCASCFPRCAHLKTSTPLLRIAPTASHPDSQVKRSKLMLPARKKRPRWLVGLQGPGGFCFNYKRKKERKRKKRYVLCRTRGRKIDIRKKNQAIRRPGRIASLQMFNVSNPLDDPERQMPTGTWAVPRRNPSVRTTGRRGRSPNV